MITTVSSMAAPPKSVKLHHKPQHRQFSWSEQRTSQSCIQDDIIKLRYLIVLASMRQSTSQRCTFTQSRRRPSTRLRRPHFYSLSRCAMLAVVTVSYYLVQLTCAFTIPTSHIHLATKFTSTIHKVASNEIITGEPIITSRSQLDKLTVKELKTLMIEQGIPSRPGSKLKKDFIDCIWDYYQNDVGVDGFEDDDAVENKVSHGKSTVVDGIASSSTGRKKPVKMPPLGDIIPDETNEEPYKLTAKDHIVLDVLERYPPLHDAVIAGCLASERTTNNNNGAIETITKGNIEQCNLGALQYNIPSGLAEADMRQIYHPMLKNATQSDLDIIFVGTASCTPGMTRGVSCTALRLNWRSKKVYTEGNDIRDNRGAMGTWLFDCGEATQLSIQKTANVKAGKISKIFITHCHGTFSLCRVYLSYCCVIQCSNIFLLMIMI